MPTLQTYKVTSAFSGTICTDPVNNTGCTSYQYNIGDFITSFGETKMSDSGIMYLIPVSGGPIPITNVENVGSNTGAGTGATGSTGATGATGGSSATQLPNNPTPSPSNNPTPSTLYGPNNYPSTTRSIIIVVVILLAIIGLLRVFKIV